MRSMFTSTCQNLALRSNLVTHILPSCSTVSHARSFSNGIASSSESSTPSTLAPMLANCVPACNSSLQHTQRHQGLRLCATSSRKQSTSRRSQPEPVVSQTGTMQVMEKAENLTAVSGSIYARPDLYDLAFSYRVFKEEFDFLRQAHSKHAPGQALSSVLELGCGPARHAIGLAKTGVPKVSGQCHIQQHHLQPHAIQHQVCKIPCQYSKGNIHTEEIHEVVTKQGASTLLSTLLYDTPLKSRSLTSDWWTHSMSCAYQLGSVYPFRSSDPPPSVSRSLTCQICDSEVLVRREKLQSLTCTPFLFGSQG